MKHFLFCFVLLTLLLGSLAGPASTQEKERPGVLDDLIEEALATNPDLKAARERWQMFERKIVPAQTLDDPRLGFTLSNYPVDSFKGDKTPMTGKEIQLSQAFPFPGKLAAKGAVAEQQALWYKGVWEDGKLQLTQKVKDAWYRLYYQDKAIAITLENISILDDFIRLTETKYEVGTGLQQDVLKAQVERSKLMDRLFTLQQQRESTLIDFNRLLARQTTTPLEVPAEIVPQEVSTDLMRLQEKAATHRPLFASYRSLIDQYRAQKNLAELDSYPDFNVFAGYRLRNDSLPDGGTDFISAGVSINLPIWRKKRVEQVAEADSGIRMAHRQYDNFRDQVFSRIHDANAQIEKNRTLVELFDAGILPQARQTFEASLSAYQVGDVDFLNLLDSLLTLYRYEIDYHRAVSDYQRSVAGLEAASGVSLEEAGSK